MKKLICILVVLTVPAAALAWAPYEQQFFTQQMQDQQVEYNAPVSAEYDPAMVPLAYMEGYESESAPSSEGPLDAD